MRGMSHLLKSFPVRNVLFLPETLVDEVPSQRHSFSSDVPALKMSSEEIKEQKKAFERAEKNKIAKEDQAAIAALEAAEESVNLPQQQEACRKLEAKNEAKREDNEPERPPKHSDAKGEHGHPADSQPGFPLHQSGQRNPQLYGTWQADHGNNFSNMEQRYAPLLPYHADVIKPQGNTAIGTDHVGEPFNDISVTSEPVT